MLAFCTINIKTASSARLLVRDGLAACTHAHPCDRGVRRRRCRRMSAFHASTARAAPCCRFLPAVLREQPAATVTFSRCIQVFCSSRVVVRVGERALVDVTPLPPLPTRPKSKHDQWYPCQHVPSRVHK